MDEHHGDALRRIVGAVPPWIVSPSFAQACASTSARDALEYARRFRRLRIYVETSVHASDAAVPAWMNSETSVLHAVTIARLSLGAALESCAQVAALHIAPTSRLPSRPDARAELARLSADAYFAALWADMHADFAISLDPDLEEIADDDRHVSLGEPSLRLTTSVSALPNISHKLERFHANASSVDADSREILNVVCRSTQAGARGWDVAVSAAVNREASRHVLLLALRAALLGMHPQLHPASRPDWARRAATRHAFGAQMRPADWDAVMKADHAGMRESARLYGCSLLAHLPAMRAPLASAGSTLGLLRSAPYDLVAPPLQAAAQGLVAAAAHAMQEIAEHRVAPLDALQAALRLHLAPSDEAVGGGSGAPCTALVRSHHAASARAYAVAYSSSWMGRTASQESACGVGDDADAAPGSGTNLTALTVVGALLTRAFRAAFTPLWLHAHGHAVRAARLHPVQFDVMHGESTSHQLIAHLTDLEMLRVQRLALRQRAATTTSLFVTLRALRATDDELARVLEARTVDDAVCAVCALSPLVGARLVLFAKVVALKNNFVCFNLGRRTRAMQIEALRRRFEIDARADADGVLAALPDHAHLLYACLECGKRPNACVDGNAKTISHNEIGIAQSMMRVGRLNAESRVRCARRSSAALRTAMGKEEDALQAGIDSMDVTEGVMERAFEDNGNTAHAARLRRDTKSVMQQLRTSHACGDRPLVEVSLVGRVVRRHGKFHALCSFCASMVEVTPQGRYGGEICCARCDSSMLGLEEARAPAARAAAPPEEPASARRQPPARAAALVPADKLTCRFCGKAPPSSGSSRFRVLHAPLDGGGRNGGIPPPLRLTAWCNSHYRQWLEGALQCLSMSVVFAHVAERAVPVFGAQNGRRELELKPPALKRAGSKGSHSQLQKRMRSKAGASMSSKRKK
jgi:hypothetical protein